MRAQYKIFTLTTTTTFCFLGVAWHLICKTEALDPSGFPTPVSIRPFAVRTSHYITACWSCQCHVRNKWKPLFCPMSAPLLAGFSHGAAPHGSWSSAHAGGVVARPRERSCRRLTLYVRYARCHSLLCLLPGNLQSRCPFPVHHGRDHRHHDVIGWLPITLPMERHSVCSTHTNIQKTAAHHKGCWEW